MSDNKTKILKYFGSCEYINKTTYTGLIECWNKLFWSAQNIHDWQTANLENHLSAR